MTSILAVTKGKIIITLTVDDIRLSNCNFDSWFGGTQMEATDARRVLPCLDEPGFKTTFDVVLGHNTAMTALSNMPDISSRSM